MALLGILLVGKCGLMAAAGLAADGHAHSPGPPGTSLPAVSAPDADAGVDYCCVDSYALVAQGISPTLASVEAAYGYPIAVHAAPRLLPAPRPRAPPVAGPSPRHVRIQVFLI